MEDIRKAQAGNEHAMGRLMRRHARLVQALAMRFEQKQDAFQSGCVGLMKAIRGFDVSRNCAFSTYAVPLILGEMRHTREKRLNWRQEKKLYAANRMRDEMIRQYGREPTVRELSEKTGIACAELALLLECTRPVQLEGEGDVFAMIPDPKGEGWLQRFFIRDILERMPAEYSYILRHRFMLDESQVQIACRLHTNQSAVSRTEKKARLMFISAWQG